MAQPLIRVLNHGGELWLNLDELKGLIADREDLMRQCLAMLVVGAEQKANPVIAMQSAFATVLMAATGADDGDIIPCYIKGVDDIAQAAAELLVSIGRAGWYSANEAQGRLLDALAASAFVPSVPENHAGWQDLADEINSRKKKREADAGKPG